MPPPCSIRMVEERHVTSEVTMMSWSPVMDLIAVANVNAEVILYRLSWQKVWTAAPHREGVQVRGLDFRPDGKVVAIGYSSGTIILVDIENAEIRHSSYVEGELTHMSWIEHSHGSNNSDSQHKSKVKDTTTHYLPRLQPLAKSYGTLDKDKREDPVEDCKKLSDQKELNMLVCGTDSATVHIFAFGVFPIGTIQLLEYFGPHICRVHSASISQDLRTLDVVIVIEDGGMNHYKLMNFDVILFASRHRELQLLAVKWGQVYTLIEYIQSTIQQMSEAWEDILLEMDSKLLKFAQTKKKLKSGTVSNDFLELLMFGTASSELEAFLLYDLTEKGLQKLGHSIEMSYSNIQKLVVKHLHCVSCALLHHLNELCGLGRWNERFGVLGLDPSLLHQAVTSAGSFLLKASELQQVIDGSIKNFKAFFRWLYVAILRLSDEQPPADINKMTQYDVNFVAKYLRDHFLEINEDEESDDSSMLEDVSISETEGSLHKRGFRLEKVGQYLKNDDLHILANHDTNPWLQFVQSSTHLTESELLYPVLRTKSLVQSKELLQTAVNTALNKPATLIGQSLKCVAQFHIYSQHQSDSSIPAKFCQNGGGESGSLLSATLVGEPPWHQISLIRHPTQPSMVENSAEVVHLKIIDLPQPDVSAATNLDSSSLIASDAASGYEVLDMCFYNSSTLSVLLKPQQEDDWPVLAQVVLSNALQHFKFTPLIGVNNLQSAEIPIHNVSSYIDPAGWKCLQNMAATSLAVSGTRKTACVLSSSRRRVQLFLLDADDEDDDDDDDEEDDEIDNDKENTL